MTTTTKKKNPFLGPPIREYIDERAARDPEFAVAFKDARDRRELARILRAAREQQNLSQAELGRRLGTKQAAIARLEAGRSSPRLDNLRAVAAALGYELNIKLVRQRTPPAPRGSRAAPRATAALELRASSRRGRSR